MTRWNPEVAVLFTTWFPPGKVGDDRAFHVAGVAYDLLGRLEGAQLTFVIADDGSDSEKNVDQVRASGWMRKDPTRVFVVRTKRLGAGGAMNAGIAKIRELGIERFYYGQDDWTLDAPFDLTPSLELMDMYDSHFAKVGLTHPHLRGNVRRHWRDHGDEYWFLSYDPTAGGYVYAERPALRSVKLYDRVGPLLEGVAATTAERDYCDRVIAAYADEYASMTREGDPMRFLHAPNATLGGPFRHINTVELGEDDPAVLTERYRI